MTVDACARCTFWEQQPPLRTEPPHGFCHLHRVPSSGDLTCIAYRWRSPRTAREEDDHARR